MGGKRKIDPELRAKMEEERKAKEAKKAKQSFIIRVCIAVVILAAAIVACVLMLNHNFNADRELFCGTYVAERRYVFTTENGNELSLPVTFSVVFCEDGRMLYRYDTGTTTNYYEYEKYENSLYSGKLLQYTDGKLADEFEVVVDESGDVVMYGTLDSVSYDVPDLVENFGEDKTKLILSSFYDEEICALLVAGDYDSITDEQLSAMNVSRENVSKLSYALKDVPVVYNLYKVSDEELSKKATAELWAQLTVSDSDAVSASDAVSGSDE